MSVEIILLLTNVAMFLALLATLSVHMWTLKQQNMREDKYIQAILAKDIREYSKAREVKSAITPVVNETVSPAYIPESDLTDKEFFDVINSSNGF